MWRAGPFAAAFLLAAAALAACSGPGRSTAADGPSDVAAEPVVVDEPFDITPYADPPVDVDDAVVHDVPEALMHDLADEGMLREMDGFRVQVYSTLDQADAVAMEEAARDWWRAAPGAAEFGDLAVYRLFRQPYYRIRVGDFADRERALGAADILAVRFPGSFVVPDRVNVRK